MRNFHQYTKDSSGEPFISFSYLHDNITFKAPTVAPKLAGVLMFLSMQYSNRWIVDMKTFCMQLSKSTTKAKMRSWIKKNSVISLIRVKQEKGSLIVEVYSCNLSVKAVIHTNLPEHFLVEERSSLPAERDKYFLASPWVRSQHPVYDVAIFIFSQKRRKSK